MPKRTSAEKMTQPYGIFTRRNPSGKVMWYAYFNDGKGFRGPNRSLRLEARQSAKGQPMKASRKEAELRRLSKDCRNILTHKAKNPLALLERRVDAIAKAAEEAGKPETELRAVQRLESLVQTRISVLQELRNQAILDASDDRVEWTFTQGFIIKFLDKHNLGEEFFTEITAFDEQRRGISP